jgi:hypothetical protein
MEGKISKGLEYKALTKYNVVFTGDKGRVIYYKGNLMLNTYQIFT